MDDAISELEPGQAAALDDFHRRGYVVIDAARQVGKTAVLKTILTEWLASDEHRGKRAVIVTPNVAMKHRYETFIRRSDGNGRGIHTVVGIRGLCRLLDEMRISPSLIIGDEVYVDPVEFGVYNDTCVACGITFNCVRTNISPPKCNTFYYDKVKETKNNVTDDMFEIEFGRLGHGDL